MVNRLFTIIAVACTVLLASCTANDLSDADSSSVNADGTRSLSEMKPEEFRVSASDIHYYVLSKAAGHCPNIIDDKPSDPLDCYDPDLVTVIPYPDNENPSVFIVNYPDYWEAVSTDKRTVPVLATGKGSFSMEDTNANLVGCIRDLASEVAFLHTYSGEIENAEVRYESWEEMIQFGKYIEDIINNYPGMYPFRFKTNSSSICQTRSDAAPDTSYHPVPGHYVFSHNYITQFVDTFIGHLTTTQWGEGAPYNQYCPKDPDIVGNHAKAGSEAVAGAQIAYYMHYANDACPEVYSTGYCDTYVGPSLDWTAIDQFDKSASNWSLFQTSDAQRMAAVLIANIGTRMQMDYGVNYSSGTLDALQAALLNEYDLESTQMAYDSFASPYASIKAMLNCGIPAIVHSGAGEDGTLPYTYIIDGCKSVIMQTVQYYDYCADDPTSYFNGCSYHFISSTDHRDYFLMNWGDYGINNEVLVVDSEDWCVHTGNHSNRQALISFVPSEGEEGGGTR